MLNQIYLDIQNTLKVLVLYMKGNYFYTVKNLTLPGWGSKKAHFFSVNCDGEIKIEE